MGPRKSSITRSLWRFAISYTTRLVGCKRSGERCRAGSGTRSVKTTVRTWTNSQTRKCSMPLHRISFFLAMMPLMTKAIQDNRVGTASHRPFPHHHVGVLAFPLHFWEHPSHEWTPLGQRSEDFYSIRPRPCGMYIWLSSRPLTMPADFVISRQHRGSK